MIAQQYVEGQWNTRNKALNFRTGFGHGFQKVLQRFGVLCSLWHFPWLMWDYVAKLIKTNAWHSESTCLNMAGQYWGFKPACFEGTLESIWKTYSKSLKPLSTRMLYLHVYSCTKTEPIPLSCLDPPRSEDEHEDRLVGEKREALILQQVTWVRNLICECKSDPFILHKSEVSTLCLL